MKINRSITNEIKQFLKKKVVLLSGPRQVGKTFLTRQLLTDKYIYLNNEAFNL